MLAQLLDTTLNLLGGCNHSLIVSVVEHIDFSLIHFFIHFVTETDSSLQKSHRWHSLLISFWLRHRKLLLLLDELLLSLEVLSRFSLDSILHVKVVNHVTEDNFLSPYFFIFNKGDASLSRGLSPEFCSSNFLLWGLGPCTLLVLWCCLVVHLW